MGRAAIRGRSALSQEPLYACPHEARTEAEATARAVLRAGRPRHRRRVLDLDRRHQPTARRLRLLTTMTLGCDAPTEWRGTRTRSAPGGRRTDAHLRQPCLRACVAPGAGRPSGEPGRHAAEGPWLRSPERGTERYNATLTDDVVRRLRRLRLRQTHSAARSGAWGQAVHRATRCDPTVVETCDGLAHLTASSWW